jgi:hypothetical protein
LNDHGLHVDRTSQDHLMVRGQDLRVAHIYTDINGSWFGVISSSILKKMTQRLPTLVIGLIAIGTDAACSAKMVRRAFAEAFVF